MDCHSSILYATADAAWLFALTACFRLCSLRNYLNHILIAVPAIEFLRQTSPSLLDLLMGVVCCYLVGLSRAALPWHLGGIAMPASAAYVVKESSNPLAHWCRNSVGSWD